MTSRYVETTQPGHPHPGSHRRRYRFKSYMEANTMERERFESMQEQVTSKIEEVMASFREDKLVVHPRNDFPELGPPSVSVPTRSKSGNWWPWGVTALFAMVVVWLIWKDQQVTPEASSSSEIVNIAPAAPVFDSGAVRSAQAHPSTDEAPAAPASVAPAAAAPADTKTAVAAALTASSAVETAREPLAIARPVAEKPAEEVAKKEKLAARSSKNRIKNRQASSRPTEHYSEDLTGLLQGK